MKKYIIMATVAMAMLFASCKNEDIKVSRNVNFKVNPYEVISGFDFEISEGELESFSTNYKLRVHLLAYDEYGFLQAHDVQYLTNYQSIMNSTLILNDGKYTAVAITDVVQYDEGVTFKYWDITGMDRLSDLKVTDQGYIGLQYKILGISNYAFEVKEGSVDHTIRVQPAGALILVFLDNMHYYSNMVRYQLDMSKSSDYCTFNSDGSYEVAIENNGGDYDWRLDYFEPEDYPSYNAVYDYCFVLPLGRTNFRWFAKDKTDTWYYAGGELSANIKIGEEYAAYLGLGDEVTAYMELVNGGKAANLPMNAEETTQVHYGKVSDIVNPQTLK
jgi:hypothetical protein